MGFEVVQDKYGTETLTQRARLHKIYYSTLINTHSSDRIPDLCTTPSEFQIYRSAICKMLYIGRIPQPIILFHAIHMAFKVNVLLSYHLKDLLALLRFDKKHIPTLRLVSPAQKVYFVLEATSDASIPKLAEGDSRGVFLIFRRSGDIAHPI